jgi:hypothetical protein
MIDVGAEQDSWLLALGWVERMFVICVVGQDVLSEGRGYLRVASGEIGSSSSCR